MPPASPVLVLSCMPSPCPAPPPALQVLAVLAYAHDNDVEPFLEPALHLCTSLLADVGACACGATELGNGRCLSGTAAAPTPRACPSTAWCSMALNGSTVFVHVSQLACTLPASSSSPGPAETQKVIAALHLLLELAGSPDLDIALAAAHCLLKAAHLHPADAAAVLAAPESMALLVGLLDQAAVDGSGAGSGGSGSEGRLALHGQQPPEPGEPGEQLPQPAFHPDCAPLLLLVLAAVVDARPELLHQYGSGLRPAVAACLAAVGDPGLKRRWAGLLARTGA